MIYFFSLMLGTRLVGLLISMDFELFMIPRLALMLSCLLFCKMEIGFGLLLVRKLWLIFRANFLILPLMKLILLCGSLEGEPTHVQRLGILF
jgi:hypothetical protein